MCPGAAAVVTGRESGMVDDGRAVPGIGDVDVRAGVAENRHKMAAAGGPADAHADWPAIIDFGLDCIERGFATREGVEIPHNLQGLIEEPWLIALCGASVLAARGLVERGIDHRALRPAASRVVVKIHRD